MSETATGITDNDGGEEPAGIGPPSQVSGESEDVLSANEETAAAEPVEATAKTADNGGEELLKSATSKDGDGTFISYATAAETKEEMAETPASGPLMLSSDKDAAAAETTTDEITEIPGSGGAEAEEPTVPAPLLSEKSDNILSTDEEPAAQVEERDHKAEIFAGFSLESNGIRFRGPKSGKTVQCELLFVLLLCACDVHIQY